MGKVNADKSRVVAPSAETPRSRNDSVDKPIPKRGSTRASRARSQGSIEPSPDVTASAKIQQLSELNRQIRSASATNPQDAERLASKRDALLAELDAIASVDVVTQSDGTVRVRTHEGNLLVDSLSPGEDTAGDIEPSSPPTSDSVPAPEVASEQPTHVSHEAAAAAYERMAPSDVKVAPPPEAAPAPVEAAAEVSPPDSSVAAPAPATMSEVSTGQTGIALVDQAVDLEAKVEILNRVEVALAESSTALGSVQSHQADVDAILG